MNLLFIAWDHPNASYIDGLFMPIFSHLKKNNREVHVLHFTKPNPDRVSYFYREAERYDLIYRHIRIPNGLLGTFFMLIKGGAIIRRYCHKQTINVLMPRVTRPALMALLSRVLGNKKPSLIYDADGLQLEERLDFAGWKKKQFRYRFFNNIEKRILKKSDVVLVRTKKAMEALTAKHRLAGKQFYKVINGRDERKFVPLSVDERRDVRESLGISMNSLLAVYAGSIAPQYCLDEMLDWFGILVSKIPRAYLLVLTNNVDKVLSHPEALRFSKQLIVKTVDVKEVPKYIGIADVGLAFRKPYFSMRGVAPIKLGEYLMMGLPVIASKGIGDTEEILRGVKATFLVDESNAEEIGQSVTWFVDQYQSGQIKVPVLDSVNLGREAFGLEKAVESYKVALEAIG